MFSRRKFIKGALWMALGSLAGCSNMSPSFSLTGPRENLPKDLISRLPNHWKFKSLGIKSNKDPYREALLQGNDLIVCGDGWLNTLPLELLREIGAEGLHPRLDFQAKSFLEYVDPNLSKCILPIAVSPWIMLFRNGSNWLPEAREGWQVLLDPLLKGRVVLPNSSRLVISIADRIDVPNSLTRLRAQTRSFDDRNGLNWLLSGEANVVVVPLRRCWSMLSRDPRLDIALPEIGAPLDWTLLARSRTSQEPFPQSWIEEAWRSPLLTDLLRIGWVPPLTHLELLKASESILKKYRSILLPAPEVWERCWSLPPLAISEQDSLVQRWQSSTP